jgi:TetR/AcrR family transcriptional regulator, cholesterol catabolism regulator
MLKEKSISRKDQIVEIATDLFMKNGYSASSMRDLANEVGIEAASLYSHFKSKEEILQIICFRMATEFFESLDKIQQANLSSSEKLSKAIHSHVLVITKDIKASAVFQNEWKHLSNPYLADFLEMRNEYEIRFRNIINEGISNGEFKNVDEKFAVMTILSSINWIHNWYKPSGKMKSVEIADNFSKLLIEGIRR